MFICSIELIERENVKKNLTYNIQSYGRKTNNFINPHNKHIKYGGNKLVGKKYLVYLTKRVDTMMPAMNPIINHDTSTNEAGERFFSLVKFINRES